MISRALKTTFLGLPIGITVTYQKLSDEFTQKVVQLCDDLSLSKELTIEEVVRRSQENRKPSRSYYDSLKRSSIGISDYGTATGVPTVRVSPVDELSISMSSKPATSLLKEIRIPVLMNETSTPSVPVVTSSAPTLPNHTMLRLFFAKLALKLSKSLNKLAEKFISGSDRGFLPKSNTIQTNLPPVKMPTKDTSHWYE